MPTTCVVDASALGALLFGEPQAESIAERLENSELIAPELLWFETASICLKKIRAEPRDAEKILSAFRYLPSLAIQQAGVDHIEVIELARRNKLTTYDATYLWLAEQLNAELVTLDKRLQRAYKMQL